jgi:hypothetical protein
MSCTSTTGAGEAPVCVVDVVISRFIQYVDEVEDACLRHEALLFRMEVENPMVLPS